MRLSRADLRRPGQILLAGGEVLAVLAGEFHLLHRAALDTGQPAANHRKHPGGLRTPVGQELDEGVTVIRRDVDEEVVGYIRRQRAAPIAVEVVAHDTQEKKNHYAGAECHDLHHAFAAASAQVCNTKPPGNSYTAAQSPREEYQQCPGERQHDQESGESRREAQKQLPIAHHPVHQKNDDSDGWAKRQQQQGRRGTNIAA